MFDFANENNLFHKGVVLTSFESLTIIPLIREHIGISLPDGILNIEKFKSKVLKNLQKVFSEMSKKTFKVVDIYTSEKSKTWANKVLGISGDTKNNGNKKQAVKTGTSNRALKV